MSSKLQAGIKENVTSVSIPVKLLALANSLPLTGVLAADITAAYYRQGASAAVAISASDLAALNSTFAAGGWKEVSNTLVKGFYRFDVPDAAFASGAEWVVICVATAASFQFEITFEISDALVSLGGGAITWTYTLTDSVTGLPIADVDVWITTDAAGANVVASSKTSAAGIATFYLDAGTYYIWRQKSGYEFTNPDTETVSA